MNNHKDINDDQETRLLVEGLLSTMKLDQVPDDDFNEDNETVNFSQEAIDWSKLSDAEEEEDVPVYATINVPSYSETSQDDQTSQLAKADFLKKFPIGKEFVDKDSARIAIQALGNDHNIPFGTAKSDAVYVKLVCKHYGDYRSGKKEDKKEKEASIIQRPNRNTMRTGCGAFVHLHIVSQLPNQPWVIKKQCYDHTHPISSDVCTYASNRKLDAHDQEYAIQMLRNGSTPGQVLKVRN